MPRAKRRDSIERGYDEEGDFLIEEDQEDRFDEEVGSSDGHNEYSFPEEDEEEYDEDHFPFDEDGEREFENSNEYPNDDSADIEDEIGHRRGFEGRRPNSLQELLGSLAQSMESERQRINPDHSESTRRVNLADVFPEMFGVMGGPVRSQNPNSRILRLVQNVSNAQEDPYIAMESLREISEQLLMMNPLTAERIIPQDELLKAIVQILSSPFLQGELDLQLISCRCLYNFFEVNPDVITAAVEKDIIPALQDKLTEISYIDLAEQVLETLEFISRLHGAEILKSGGLNACLQYLDFFTTHAQRKAVTIASNSCARIRVTDFDNIQKVFPSLKEVFISGTDHIILGKVLNAFYGICGGLSKEGRMLETIFDFDLIERFMQLIRSPETSLEGKLKSLDILSQIAATSCSLSKQIIVSGKVMNMLNGCLNEYKKSSDSPLHETLMFVPKPLLTSISRFVVLLLPAEEEQVLSIDARKNVDLSDIDDHLTLLVKEISPVLVDFFTNTVDFDIRRYVLIAFARISTSLRSSNVSNIDKNVIGMIASSLTQNKYIFENSNCHDMKAGALLLGILSLTCSLVAKYATEFLLAFKREGIFDLLKSLSESLVNSEEINDNSNDSSIYEDDDTQTHDASNSDDDYEMEFDDMDIPDQVKPKKLTFNIFKKLRLNYLITEITAYINSLSQLSQGGESAMDELRDIDDLVLELQSMKHLPDSFEEWFQLWQKVRLSIFRPHFNISSFEFISTGLAKAMANLIPSTTLRSNVYQSSLVMAFGDKLADFVQILQSALTRLESFEIVECGLQGDEGRAGSLGKQMKIKLEYVGDLKEDKVPVNIQSIVVAIHCIASFKSLNDFLKHRIIQSQFLNSLLPGLSHANISQEDLQNWRFEFFISEKPVKSAATVFGTVFNEYVKDGRDTSEIWNDIQTIKYRKVEKVQDDTSVTDLYPLIAYETRQWNPADEIMKLLGCAKHSSLRDENFVNAKLSAKLSRQLEEPLVVAGGALPTWTLYVTRNFPFLFPFETRMFFLQSTSFGYGRLIQLWRNRTNSDKNAALDSSLQQLGRPTRHKLRISRKTIFLSALKIINKYGSTPNILEIEYQDEVGTGLGPTLEFYAVVSKEFARKSLGMWRHENCDSHDQKEFVDTSLFPAPILASKDEDRIVELFKHLGNFVSRSMLDNRILDFRFNRAFFEITHSVCRGGTLDLDDPKLLLGLLSLVDNQIAKSLGYLLDQQEQEDFQTMCLTFTLPGYDIELVENGREVIVDSSNVQEYIKKVIDQMLVTGIERQVKSFIEGFSRAFPYSSLLILTPEELTRLFGQVEEDWSTETLYSCMNADHGYTMDSPSVNDLILVMTTFSLEERRLFLQFLTGSPKLPIGGFKSLNPRLTVVLKHPEEGQKPDEYLPSVMTCANYLKLPKYSNKEILRSRISQAMNEGSGAFLLS
ncbi:LAFE_0H13652g1_1 [Lachancea fermentati]|uniref:HECT-type E3 ubiquitin transferase n=1 Tax=Lachancea fermentati TaxID=4955 RepID=A0A1G4MKQ2_LACFM|nr:LAFE_0H13652g1_1 [Lachancea fermentati]